MGINNNRPLNTPFQKDKLLLIHSRISYWSQSVNLCKKVKYPDMLIHRPIDKAYKHISEMGPNMTNVPSFHRIVISLSKPLPIAQSSTGSLVR